ncbi:MAG: hypothetical protein GY817_00065 [bacterium]|nr:hypothetical protein [bacterium]
MGLLHGKMNAENKNNIMQKFINGTIKILISTTVIEVGVNIPNATVMVIEHAERFGLSTLHQLRGKIGRGKYHSACFLVPNKMNDKAKIRLAAMINHSDGFKLAEEDLNLRGPGEFLGKNQHGFLNLTIGDITTDLEIIEIAKIEAESFLLELKKTESAQPKISTEELINLEKQIKFKFGKKIDFLQI